MSIENDTGYAYSTPKQNAESPSEDVARVSKSEDEK
jgi:hypothetical protein